MKIATFIKWTFVYLPKRFSIALLLLVLWFLLVAWPKIIYEWDLSRLELPWWIKFLNLEPAARALSTLLVLFAGLLLMYNLAAFFYRLTRRIHVVGFFVVVIIFTALLLAYPWVVLWDVRLIPGGTNGLIPFSWTENLGWLWNTSVEFGDAEYRIIWLYIPLLFPLLVSCLSLAVVRYYRKEITCPIDASRTIREGDIHNDKFRNERKKGRFQKIGIILSGGGAKGVYQAGALKAIDEFLRIHEAQNDVRMIAGTSIGSWNSLFWLAGLINAKPGEMSLHEKWWSTVDVRRLIQFDWYWPLRKNSFLLNLPWKEDFDKIFGKNEFKERLKTLWKESVPNAPSGERSLDQSSEIKPTTNGRRRIHFYLTRSNVGRAHLEFSTNWDEQTRKRGQSNFPQDRFTEVTSLGELKTAVFASMDLPPLFPYMQIDCETFEDGGVVDNLPVIFGTAVEECDLLFVLMLNASFESEPDTDSILKRMLRVMDVRQGVMERNSLKLTYLFNEEYALGQQLKRELKIDGDQLDATVPKAPVMVVAICPDRPLKVGTAEFWKTGEFGCAFKIMYEATRTILEKFDFSVDPSKPKDPRNWIKIHLVSPQGHIGIDDDL